MKKSTRATLGVAAGLAVLVLALLWLWRGDRPPPDSGGPPRSEPIAAAEPTALSATPPPTEQAPASSRSVQSSDPAIPRTQYFGIVLQDDGKPLGGVTLTLFPTVEDWRHKQPLGSVSSGADGQFKIDIPAWGDAKRHPTLLAQASGYSEWSSNAIVPEKEIRISLPQVEELFGTVVDAEVGTPIPGATVFGGGEVTGPEPEVMPLLVDASVVASLLNISQRHVHRMDILKQVPEPVRLGRSVRWRREEIDAWVAAGCPRRASWNWRSAVAAPRSFEQGS